MRYYARALRVYVDSGALEANLLTRQVGARAVRENWSIEDISFVHHELLLGAFENAQLNRVMLRSAQSFLCHVTSFHDQAISGYRELGGMLKREVRDRRREASNQASMSEELARSRERLTFELSRSNRKLRDRTEELERINEKLMQQQEEQRSFVYSISHDLKSPANTIQSVLQMFIEDNAESDVDFSDLKLVLGVAERMKVLLDDLLNYTRVLSTEGERKTINLNAILSDVVDDLSGAITEANAQITVGDLPDVVGAPFMIRLLFQNLISNAIKFRKPDTAPLIEVKDVSPIAISHVRIAVTDNGLGIAKEYHEKIFRLFARLHSQEDFPGSGLGLALCNRVLQAHDGEITVESELGRGCTFYLKLPC